MLTNFFHTHFPRQLLLNYFLLLPKLIKIQIDQQVRLNTFHFLQVQWKSTWQLTALMFLIEKQYQVLCYLYDFVIYIPVLWYLYIAFYCFL